MTLPPHILITRPRAQGERLSQQLATHHFTSTLLPLFEIESLAHENVCKVLTQAQKIIFVSRYAVLSLSSSELEALRSFQGEIFAIGTGTASEIRQLGIENILYPPAPHNSESLLALPQLQAVTREVIAIVAGRAGRTLLQATLTERGAQVLKIETYARRPIDYPHAELEKALNAIDCIVITSQESLNRWHDLISKHLWMTRTDPSQIPLLVISESMLISARSFEPLQPIIVSKGADDLSILSALTTSKWITSNA